MRQKTMCALFLALLLVTACVPLQKPVTSEGKPAPAVQPATLREYGQAIDYSCETGADCAVKDVHNCCGYFPRCVNKGAQVSPDLVKKLCEKEQLVGVCGFPAVSGCDCVSGECVSRSTASSMQNTPQ